MNFLHQSSLPKMLGRSGEFFVPDILEDLDQFEVKMQEVLDQIYTLVGVGKPWGNVPQRGTRFAHTP